MPQGHRSQQTPSYSSLQMFSLKNFLPCQRPWLQMTAQNINKIAGPMHLSSGQCLEFYNKKEFWKKKTGSLTCGVIIYGVMGQSM